MAKATPKKPVEMPGTDAEKKKQEEEIRLYRIMDLTLTLRMKK